ncbi:unnamed protein product [Closterium sp. Yama58-4]|nr:unnamed protein product [Closterium sp. Yama58-4]
MTMSALVPEAPLSPKSLPNRLAVVTLAAIVLIASLYVFRREQPSCMCDDDVSTASNPITGGGAPNGVFPVRELPVAEVKRPSAGGAATPIRPIENGANAYNVYARLPSSPADTSNPILAAAAAEEKKPFVYVYDFGPNCTDKTSELDVPPYALHFDLERKLTEQILSDAGGVRTRDPKKASLFFVPFYSARLLQYFLSVSKGGSDMRDAVEKTSQIWRAMLTKVRAEPHFYRSNGRDHFSILSTRNGRCDALTYINPKLLGEMFFVTYNGDTLVRSVHTGWTPDMRVLSYNYGAPINVAIPDIACYSPGRDVVVPPLLTQTHVIPPSRGPTAAAGAAAESGVFSGDSAAAAAAPPAYGGRTIRVLMVTSAANVADISNSRINEGLHHNYPVEKWLIEIYASNAAAIEGWKVVFRNDNEEALGVRGDAPEIPRATATAADGAAGDAGAANGAADGGSDGAAAGDNSEWGNSVFCLILPGRAQWSFQLAKAILSGCIPVTFLRANDNPWAASLYHHSATASSPSALNYPVFSLNIDPAAVDSLPRRLQEAFDQPGLVARLQHNLGLVQDMFKWHDSLDQGAGAVLMSRLRRIGAAAAAQSQQLEEPILLPLEPSKKKGSKERI